MTATGGSAFPGDDAQYFYPGMTLRDYFAAKAMQAMISAITTMDDTGLIRNRPKDVAELAWLYADVMIEEHDK